MSGFTIRHIAAALGGKVTSGTSCNVPGPGHGKGDESLSVKIGRGGRLIVYSHAGDDWKACRDYVHERLGLTPDIPRHQRSPFIIVAGNTDEEREKKKAAALKIWHQAVSPAGTLVERYLRDHRCLDLPADLAVAVIRFHASLRLDEFTRKPAMVCLFRDINTNEPCAIHRTFLDRETAQKIDRKMLGPVKGAAIKSGEISGNMVGLTIGEGIETVLSARAAGHSPGWALGSSGAVAAFPVLKITEISVLEENDPTSRRDVRTCLKRYLSSGKPVNIIRSHVGSDFNDAWKAMNR